MKHSFRRSLSSGPRSSALKRRNARTDRDPIRKVDATDSRPASCPSLASKKKKKKRRHSRSLHDAEALVDGAGHALANEGPIECEPDASQPLFEGMRDYENWYQFKNRLREDVKKALQNEDKKSLSGDEVIRKKKTKANKASDFRTQTEPKLVSAKPHKLYSFDQIEKDRVAFGEQAQCPPRFESLPRGAGEKKKSSTLSSADSPPHSVKSVKSSKPNPSESHKRMLETLRKRTIEYYRKKKAQEMTHHRKPPKEIRLSDFDTESIEEMLSSKKKKRR